SLTVKTRLQATAAERTLATDLDLPLANVIAGSHKIRIERLSNRLETRVQGDPASGPVAVSHVVNIGKVEQDFVPEYPIADTTITIRAGRSGDGTLRLDALQIENRGGGTSLRLDGALVLPRTTLAAVPAAADAPIGFHSTEVQLALSQKLDRLTGAPAQFRG